MKSKEEGMEAKRKLFLTPILSVQSVDGSLRYYKEKLGFKIGFRWSDKQNMMIKEGETTPATFASIYLEEIEIFLSEKNQGNPGTWLCLNYQDKKDLEDFCHNTKRNDAIIKSEMELKPWGMVEAVVSDLDGHCLRFGAPK